ncbi:hypothetical protein BHD05_11150 [Marisediminicola antarctica]|uniref:Uncharacterized protein n=2 Tax=Marisediminicola antarctica TaxID=674079 RepID=A0A7L5AHR7_9MICO|nr:hypothetical protein BHD05_11150 [Marisediminicola antarctica]
MEALLEQLPKDDPAVELLAKKAATLSTRAYLPGPTPSPDLVLIGLDDEEGNADILAVIEVKVWANMHFAQKASANKLVLLTDPGATAVHNAVLTDGSDEIGQVDLYRSRKWWGEGLVEVEGGVPRPDDKIRLTNPDEVLWLLFDVRGRPAEKLFEKAHSSTMWRTIDLRRFGGRLRELRSTDPALIECHRDTIAVVLWHINQRPGRTTPYAEGNSISKTERPPLSDFEVQMDE